MTDDLLARLDAAVAAIADAKIALATKNQALLALSDDANRALQRADAVEARCPDCGIQMTEVYGPLAPGGPSGRSWECPRCGGERMWPDPPGPR